MFQKISLHVVMYMFLCNSAKGGLMSTGNTKIVEEKQLELREWLQKIPL